MRPTWRIWGMWASVGLTVGCSSAGKAPYADNPLLQAREPLLQSTAKVGKPKPVTSDRLQNSPATLPASAARIPSPVKTTPATMAATVKDAPTIPSFSKTPPSGPALSAPVIVPAKLTSPTEPAFVAAAPAPALPAPPPPPPLPTLPASPIVSGKTYDHAPNHAWLQGEFDIHYRGHKELRFRPLSEDDALGGKVRLVDDPRLADVKPGDVIRVEGELIRDDVIGSGQYPRYQVRSVQVVERKSAKADN